MKNYLFKLSKLAMIVAIVLIAGCTKELQLVQTDLTSENGRLKSIEMPCGVPSTCTLWAGQTHDWGTVTIANDEANLYVTYTATEGTFGTLHLWVGTDLANLPTNTPGNLEPGHFPYIYNAEGLTTYTFTIPLLGIPFNTDCGSKMYVVAHAEMGTETAFAGGIKGTIGTRWWFYSEYTVQCCDNPPGGGNPGVKLGTAFAKGGYVFTTDKKSNPDKLPSLNLTKNRWGWAVNLKSPGTTTYDLWVGAGLNNTPKGLMVGSVEIAFDGAKAVVTYIMNNGYAIEEAHVYAGDLKPSTLAPGQYGNVAYFLYPDFATGSQCSFILDVTDTNSDGVWFICHAVVWGPGVTNI